MKLFYRLSRKQRVWMLLIVCAVLALVIATSLLYLPNRESNQIRFGAAVSVGALRNDQQYRELLAREVSIITPEVAMKWEVLHVHPDRYDFGDADTLVQFAEANHILVRGHTLVWHEQLPGWLTQGTFSRDQVLELLHNHIAQVVGRYRGRVVAWDVVNEAVADDGTLRKTFWLEKIGPEYIELAFQWAREADPDALLFYNDYGAETPGRKADAVYELVHDLVERGVPINGVGLQAHFTILYQPLQAQIAQVMARLAALGLRTDITELDVQAYGGIGTAAERLETQARVYRAVASACAATPSCQVFITWGISDRYSWIPSYTGHPDTPLLFDEQMQPKPFYRELRDILRRPDGIPAT